MIVGKGSRVGSPRRCQDTTHVSQVSNKRLSVHENASAFSFTHKSFVFAHKSGCMFLGSRTAAFELSDPQRPPAMAAAVAQRPVLLAEQRHGRWGKRRAAAAASPESISEATVGQLQALSEHGSLLFPQTRTETEPQPLAGPTPDRNGASASGRDSQALPWIECAESHEEEHDETKTQHTRAGPLPWLPLLLVAFLFLLYAALQQEAATRFELWFYEHGTLSGRDDWHLMARAGMQSRLQSLSTASQRGDTNSHRGRFLLVLGAAQYSNLSSAPHTAVVPMDAADNWRECVRKRSPELNPQAWPGSYTLDGKELLEDFPVAQLCDRTVRLRQYPLPGGMPPPDFASMRKSTLMYRPGRPSLNRTGVHTGRGDSSTKLRRSVRRSGKNDRGQHRKQVLPRTKRVLLHMRPPVVQHTRANRVLPHSGPAPGRHRWRSAMMSTRRRYASNVHRGALP